MTFCYFFRRNLDYFQSCHISAMNSVDSDNGNGELVIRLPNEVLPIVQGMYDMEYLFSRRGTELVEVKIRHWQWYYDGY